MQDYRPNCEWLGNREHARLINMIMDRKLRMPKIKMERRANTAFTNGLNKPGAKPEKNKKS